MSRQQWQGSAVSGVPWAFRGAAGTGHGRDCSGPGRTAKAGTHGWVVWIYLHTSEISRV